MRKHRGPLKQMLLDKIRQERERRELARLIAQVTVTKGGLEHDR